MCLLEKVTPEQEITGSLQVRTVATALAINPMTVSRAYSTAESEGFLERQIGKGMVVAVRSEKKAPATRRLALLEPELMALARQVKELELPTKPVVDRLAQLLDDNRSAQ